MQRPKNSFTLLACACVLIVLGTLPVFAQQAAGGTNLPDSPGAILVAQRDQPQQPSEAQPQSQPQTSGTPSTQSQSGQAQAAPVSTLPPQRPVGTAAAEGLNTSGVAASQPAGVAIAPAKQRRVRTIILRTGAIIGAGVAIGTIVALSAGTSSKPPGAR